jgi:cytidine deaminase
MLFKTPDAPEWEPLLAAAWRARAQAYAPYSGFQVGAALLWQEANVSSGCNVENASYPLCLCAERTALCAATTQGMKPGQPKALVIVTESARLTPPCGACRQVLAEFAEDLPVLLANREARALHRLAALLPLAFTGRDLPEDGAIQSRKESIE